MSSNISRSVFNKEIREIYSKSIKLGDDWSLVVHNQNEDIIYLEKKSQQLYQNDIITIVFHVIYSESYSVPILYTNISRSNGSIFKYGEMYNFFNLVATDKNQESGLILTQQEHPILFIPFYFMHPCKTSEWMNRTALRSKESLNYTLKWLSFVFSVLQIPLDIKYALD